jgi:hypothetical protein
VLEIAETVAAAVAERTGAEPVQINHLPMRPGEPEGDVVLADTSSLEVIGIKKDELTTLGDGVKATVTYYAHTV